jgi:NAD(P)-dependent dehydrogenase (short-subunit alcohol dehydrogenase family)
MAAMGQLQDRVALVTGGGRGIGRAIALAYAAEGAQVAVSARTTMELDEVVGAIRAKGGRATAFSADLSNRDVARGLVGEVASKLGPVDILVNNAGIGSSSDPRPIIDYDDDFWELTLTLNLTAPYLLSKAALPAMIRKKWGRIINIASVNGKVPSLHGAAYTASKHGLLGLTKTLALEVATDGITVNAICPGPVHTIMSDRRLDYDCKRLGISKEDRERSLTPIGRFLEPDEIAPLAVYLAGTGSAMVTGQALNVCGGMVMV